MKTHELEVGGTIHSECKQQPQNITSQETQCGVSHCVSSKRLTFSVRRYSINADQEVDSCS